MSPFLFTLFLSQFSVVNPIIIIIIVIIIIIIIVIVVVVVYPHRCEGSWN